MGDLNELKIYDYRMKVTEGELVKKPFIVPTPRPYVIDLADFEDELQTKMDLLFAVDFLRDIMRRLKIAEAVAYNLELTLNIHTGDTLRGIAFKKGDMKTLKLINDHKW